MSVGWKMGSRIIPIILVAIGILLFTADRLVPGLEVTSTIVLLSYLQVLIIFIAVTIGIKIYIAHPLRRMCDRLELLAAGDFTGGKIPVKENNEIGRLARVINSTQEMMNQTLGTISRVASKLADHSGSLAASAEEITATVEDMSANTSSIAASAEKVSSSSRDAAVYGEDVEAAARGGREKSEESAGKINAVRETIDDVAGSTENLHEKSHHIAEIIQVITNIAEQTDLLALNAAIEAARAGEHGRGFAVVAEEVRQLADQSNKSAGEISQLLKEIYAETEDMVKRVRESQSEIGEGVALVEETSSRLGEILDRILEINKRVNSIAEDAKLASEGTSHLASSSQEIAAGTTEAAQAAQTLSEMAEELRGVLSKYNFVQAH